MCQGESNGITPTPGRGREVEGGIIAMIFRFIILAEITVAALEAIMHANDGHSFWRLAMGVLFSIVAVDYTRQIRQLFVSRAASHPENNS